jgi:hypothetical protein
MHRKPRNQCKQDGRVKAKKGSVGLAAYVSVQLDNLEKNNAAHPDQPDQPFP